ncbi:MAG TPA: hypothetical protein VFA89_16745 [Terriglobales bacterium]|nr:hypothetical protein [Terriglobales bacterium]
MKSGKCIGTLLALALLLPLGALAADNGQQHHEKFTLVDSVQVGNTLLQPGDYKAEWNGTGPNVQVEILHGKKTVATVPAQVIEKNQPSPYSDVIVKPNGNTKTIDEIDFANKKESLKLAQGQSSGM